MKFKIVLLLLTAFVITANSGTPRLSPWDAWRMAYTSFEKGEEFRDKGDYTKAKDSFDKALGYYKMVRESRPDWNQKVISERIAECEKESSRMTAFLGPAVKTGAAQEKVVQTQPQELPLGQEIALRRELSEAKAELEELRRRNEVRKNYESEISNLLRDQRALHERYSLLEKRFRAQEEKASRPDKKVKDLEAQLIALRLQLDLARKESAAAKQRSNAADAGRIALQKEKRELDNARRLLKGKLDSLQIQLQNKENQLASHSRSLTSAQQKIDELNTALTSSRNSSSSLQRELDALQVKYREKLAASGAGETANRKLLEDNKRLQESNTALRNTEQENARQIASLQREIEKIRTRLSDEITRHTTAASQLKEKNSSLDSLNKEFSREKERAAIIARELEDMRNNANSAAAEMKKLVSENSELKRRLQFRESEDFKNLTAARSDRRRLQGELRKYEEQIAGLRAELRMSGDKVKALERAGKELQSENRKLHAERITYEDRVKALINASSNAKEMAKQFSQLQANFAALQAENRQNKLAAEAAKPREAELARIKLRLAELDGLKQQLRREQSFNEQLNAMKIRQDQELRQLRQMGTENAALKARLADHQLLKSEVERLRKLSAELAGAQKLTGQIAELKMELARTQPEAAEAKKLRRQNQELLQGRVLWENESSKLKLQLSSLNQQLQQLEKVRAEAAQKEASLQKAAREQERLSAENRSLANKAAALETLRAKTAKLVADQAKTIEMLRNAETQIRRLKAEAAANLQFKQQIAQVQAKSSSDQKTNAALIADLRRENAILKSLNTKNANQEQLLAEMRILNNRMRAELEQLRPIRSELARLSGELKKSHAGVEKLKRENDRLITVASEVKRIETENRRIQQLNRELSDRSLKAESELASLKSELANYSRLRTEAERLRKLTAELADARNLAPALAQAKLQIARLEQLRDELNRQRNLNEELTRKRAALEKELAARPMPAFAPADYTPAAALKPPGKAEDYIAAGKIAAADDKPELAVWNYRTALKLSPDNSEAAELLGRLLAQREDFAEAAPLLSRARNAKPDAIGLALETARAYTELKRYGNAEAIIEPLLKRNPDDPHLQIAAARIAAGNGQHARASGLFQLAAARLPKDPLPKLELARLLYNTDSRRITEAVKLYEEARRLGAAPDLELEPKFAPMLNKRSTMTNFLSSAAAEAAKNKDWSNVIWYNRQLIELDREPEKYLPRLAFAQYKKGSSGAALETLSMGKVTPLSLLVKAFIHLQRDEEREAIQCVMQAKNMNLNQPVELPADWTEFLLDFKKYGKSLAAYVK